MKSALLLTATLAVHIASAQYLVAVPSGGIAAPGTTSDCSAWVQQSYSLTCELIEAYFDITEAEFELWNPITTELGPNCTLIPDVYYCVAIDYTPLTTPPPFTPSPTVVMSTTSTGSTATTPSPIEPSTDPSCTSYHYVVTGDTCEAIEQEYGITAAEFNAWNPEIGATCEFLDLNEYICVAAPYTSTTVTSTTSTTSSSLPYPTPLQPGSWQNCSAYHLVVSGDYCSLIESEYGITTAQFNDWNPEVGAACPGLDLNDYVCVGAPGATQTTTTTSSTTGTPAPSPIEAGTISTCKTYHLVVQGDYCALLEENYGITAAQFNAWNPDVGTSCAGLDLGEYVCVGV